MDRPLERITSSRHGLTALLVALVASGASLLPAQEIARPFLLPDLAADQQAGAVRVAIGGNRAVLEEREVDGTIIAAYSQLAGAAWQRDEALWTGEADAFAVRESSPYAVVAVGQEVRTYSEFVAGDWVYNGSSQSVLLPVGEKAQLIEMAGTRMAVVTSPTGLVLNGGNVVRIYVQGGGSWSEEAAVEILRDDPPFGPSRTRFASIAFDGSRLAVLLADGSEIGIFGRDVGGALNWGLEKSLLPAPGHVFGESIALAGDRLLVRATTGAPTDNGIDLHQRNTGGTAQWGRSGRILALPADIEVADIDSSGGCLMVTGYPRLESLFSVATTAAQAWMFEPGGGLGGYAFETQIPLGDPGLVAGLGLGSLGTNIGSLADLSGDDAVAGIAIRGVGRASAWGATFLHDDFDFGWDLDGVWGRGMADGFSSALAFGDGYLVTGNPGDNYAGSSSGSAFLWQMVVTGQEDGQLALPRGRLESPDTAAGQMFGSAVDTAFLSDGSIIIGGGGSGSGDQVTAVAAVGDNGARGAVYVFDPGAPGGVVRLDPEEPLGGADYFGWAVAFARNGTSGDAFLAVGAPGDDEAGLNAGAVYVFRRNQGGDSAWGLTTKILRPAAIGGRLFGAVLAADTAFSPTLVVGRQATSGNPGRIAYYSLSGSGSTPLGLREAPAGDPVDFAASVAVDTGVIAVGATGTGGADGRVYFYSVLDPAGAPVVLPAPAGVGGAFGGRLAMDYPFLAVGSPEAAGGAGNVSSFLLAPPWLSAPGLSPQLLFSRNGTGSEGLGDQVGSWFLYTASGAPGSNAFGTAAGRVRLDRAGTYEIYAKTHGLISDVLFDPHGDPDGDGQTSLEEFALGSLAHVAGSLGTFELRSGTWSGGGDSGPAMVWDLPPALHAREWLDFRVETGSALTAWSLANFRGDPDPDQDRFYLLPPGATHGFYRFTPRYPWPNQQSGYDSGF